MFEFFNALIEKLSSANPEKIYLYLIYFFGFLLIVSMLYFVYSIGKTIFSVSNFTMRKLMLSAPNPKKKIRSKNKVIVFLERQLNKTVFKKIYINNCLLLEKAGMYTQKRLIVFIATRWFIIPIFSFLVCLINKSFIKGAVLFLFLEILILITLIMAIQDEERKFQKTSYRLFKFLRTQMSSGIRVTDALNSLHIIVNDPLLNKRLTLMAAHYSSTNDIEKALLYITDYYKIHEAKSLTLSIKQAIETGQNESGFKEKERTLFNRFINGIKKDTQMVIVKYVFIGLLYTIVIITIIGYPFILDFIKGSNEILAK